MRAPSVRLPSGQSDTRTIPRKPAPKTDKKGKADKKRVPAPEKTTVRESEAPAPETKIKASEALAPDKQTDKSPEQTVPAPESGIAANAPAPAEAAPHGKRDRDLEPDRPRYFGAAVIGLALAALLLSKYFVVNYGIMGAVAMYAVLMTMLSAVLAIITFLRIKKEMPGATDAGVKSEERAV